MTDPTRYRIVCADGTVDPALYASHDDAAFTVKVIDAPSFRSPCGPHTVEPVEPEQAR